MDRICAICRQPYRDTRGGHALCDDCSHAGASAERKRIRERNRPGRTARLAERRLELIRLINPEMTCQKCGAKPGDTSQLHVDHQDGKGWRSRTLSLSSRIARYYREFKSGVRLRVLCEHCNCGYLNNSWRDGRVKGAAALSRIGKRR